MPSHALAKLIQQNLPECKEAGWEWLPLLSDLITGTCFESSEKQKEYILLSCALYTQKDPYTLSRDLPRASALAQAFACQQETSTTERETFLLLWYFMNQDEYDEHLFPAFALDAE